VVFKVVVPTMERMLYAAVGDVETSIAQHFMAAQIAQEVVEAMIPMFSQAPEIAGHVVIGTSAGDFHGLGKRIVSGCLAASLIEVSDLGLGVPASRFVDEALAVGAQVIAISSMMVHTARAEQGCRGVRRILRQRGLEGRIKVVVGGAPYRFDENLFRAVGADAWARTAVEAVPVIVRLIREAGSP
jgi:5-methyltetrahydrofolate--homocysteine methyltransferase